MNPRLRSAMPIAASVVALVGTLFVLRLSNSPSPKAHETSPAPSADQPAVRPIEWPEDKALVYTVDHHAQQSLDLPGSTSVLAGPSRREEVFVDVDADLVLQKCSGDGAVTWLGVRLENIRKLRLVVGGEDKIGNPSVPGEADGASQAYLAVSPIGQLHAVAFPQGADGSYQRVMQHLLQQISVVVSSTSTWRTLEVSPFGQADTLYTSKSGAAEQHELTKERLALQPSLELGDMQDQPSVSIASRYDISLTEGRFVNDLSGSDRLTTPDRTGGMKELGSARTKVHLREQRDASPLAMPSAEQLSLRPAGEPYVAPEEQRAWLEQRAGGITFDQVYDAVADVADSAAFPGHQELLVQATAYLALHPEDCAKLAPLFIDPEASSVRRGFVLDLLVSTDTPTAQAELRRLLETSEAQQDPSADMLLQRLSFVRQPDADTVAMISERFSGASGDSRYASAYAMASMVHHLDDNAKPGEARALNSQLLEAIDSAPSDDDRAKLVRSLSGTRSTENVDALSRYAGSQDASVRAAAAYALRETQTPESERVVRKLLSDSDTQVKSEALRTMAKYSLDDDTLKEMVGLAASRTIEPDLYGDVYNVLTNYQSSKPELVKDAAQQMLAQNVDDRQVRVRLQFMASGM